MKILSWNSYGLGKPHGNRALQDLVRKEVPIIIFFFLQETKLVVKKVEKLKYSLGFENCLAIGSVGPSGDLALFWKKEISLTVTNFSKHHINACVKEE